MKIELEEVMESSEPQNELVAEARELLSEIEWWNEVIRICEERGYAKWFYADRKAWLEAREEMTPEQAVDYQLECLF